MEDKEFIKFVLDRLKSHGLWKEGWEFSIVPDLQFLGLETGHGYTNFEDKVLIFSRENWPTLERNMKEQVLHEIAHALVGHGEHTLDWWDKLIDIGGRGIWVEHPNHIKSIGVTIIYK